MALNGTPGCYISRDPSMANPADLTYIYAVQTRITDEGLFTITDRELPNAVVLGIWCSCLSRIEVDVSEDFITRNKCINPNCQMKQFSGPLCFACGDANKGFLHELSKHMVEPLNINGTYLVIIRTHPQHIDAISRLMRAERLIEIDQRPIYQALNSDDEPDFPCDIFYDRLRDYYLVNCRLSSYDFFGTPEMAFLDYLMQLHAEVDSTERLCDAVDAAIKVMTNYDIWGNNCEDSD